MKALILCGGPATRLGKTAGTTPKTLLPVAGRAFLEYLFDQLREAGLRDVVLAVGHLGRRIEAHVGDGSRFGLSAEYSRETKPLGTGGAVVNALDLLGETFLVMNGDSRVDLDLGEFLEFEAEWGGPAMVLVRVKDRGRFGTVATQAGLVTEFAEKAGSSGGLINAGVYILRKTDFEGVARGVKLSLETDLFPRWAGCIRAFVTDARFFDIGTPESYEAVK
jgi:NDP-sugar pyrophosphorylase family protein